MKIGIINIGKIKKTEIEINSISVIGGENNTGKSTISKSLFAIFSSLYKVKYTVQKEKIKIISRLINEYLLKFLQNNYAKININLGRIRNFSKKLSEQICNKYDNGEFNFKFLDIELKKIINILNNVENTINFEKENIEELYTEIDIYLNFEEKVIVQEILQDRLNEIFNNRVKSIFKEEHISLIGNIALYIKDIEINAKIDTNNLLKIEKYTELNIEPIYIDNPFVLDNKVLLYDSMSTDKYLKNQIFRLDNEYSLIEKIVNKERIDKIIKKLDYIFDGELEYDSSKGKYFYNYGENETLELESLSSGLKSFIILKMLLDNMTIKDKSLIILDEPEVHLHPKWQQNLAEILIILQKEFNLHILINTHSPYFLRAIEVYSKKYEINDIKYYLSYLDGKFAKIDDVTKNIESIYEKLAEPLLELDEENDKYE